MLVSITPRPSQNCSNRVSSSSCITPIFLPPDASDHNPVEHVWNTAKNHISNIQHDTPEKTYMAFIGHITGSTFNYDSEHLPNLTPTYDLV